MSTMRHAENIHTSSNIGLAGLATPVNLPFATTCTILDEERLEQNFEGEKAEKHQRLVDYIISFNCVIRVCLVY